MIYGLLVVEIFREQAFSILGTEFPEQILELKFSECIKYIMK